MKNHHLKPYFDVFFLKRISDKYELCRWWIQETPMLKRFQTSATKANPSINVHNQDNQVWFVKRIWTNISPHPKSFSLSWWVILFWTFGVPLKAFSEDMFGSWKTRWPPGGLEMFWCHPGRPWNNPIRIHVWYVCIYITMVYFYILMVN